jgi:HSP20 family protein
MSIGGYKMKDKKAKEETNLAPRIEFAPAMWKDRFEPHPGFTPFSMMRRFTDDMERFFDDFGAFRTSPLDFKFDVPMEEFQTTMWSPEIEVSRTNGDLVVRADLPGLKKGDINVEFKDGSLVISGERNQETKKEDDGFFTTERSYGSFYRSIPLPEGVDAEKATAKFENGVLDVKVAVPKSETTGRKLEITEGEGKSEAKAA